MIFQVIQLHLTGDQFGMTGTTSQEILGSFDSKEKAQKFLNEYLENHPGISKYACWISELKVN